MPIPPGCQARHFSPAACGTGLPRGCAASGAFIGTFLGALFFSGVRGGRLAANASEGCLIGSDAGGSGPLDWVDLAGSMSGAKATATTERDASGRFVLTCRVSVPEAIWGVVDAGTWLPTAHWRLSYRDGSFRQTPSLYRQWGAYGTGNFTWVNAGNRPWGDFCSGSRRHGVDLGCLEIVTKFRLRKSLGRAARMEIAAISCVAKFTSVPDGRYSIVMGIFPVNASSSDWSVRDVGTPTWTHGDVGGSVADREYDGVGVEYVKFLVGLVAAVGAFVIVGGFAMLVYITYTVARAWCRRRMDDAIRGRLIAAALRRGEAPGEGNWNLYGLGLAPRPPRGHPDNRRLPAAVAGIVPAVVAASVAVAAITALPGAYGVDERTFWSGGLGSGLPGDSHHGRRSPFREGAGDEAGQHCPRPSVLQASLEDAREALGGPPHVDTHLKFECPALGKKCEALCRFSGSGQFFDAVLSWAAESGHASDDVRRDWRDHECDVRRSCKIDRSASKDTDGASPPAKMVCGFSGVCRWDFGLKGNDLAGVYRCALYYAPEFLDLPDQGSARGQVSVEPGSIAELALQPVVAESSVLGCTPPTGTPSIESIITFTIIYYRHGVFNWTVDGPLDEDGVPRPIGAGAIVFNRTHTAVYEGEEGRARSFVKPPVDTVTGREDGMLKFTFTAFKPGVYHGLFVLDTLRRFSCVLTVPEDPCDLAKPGRSGNFATAAAIRLPDTTDGDTDVRDTYPSIELDPAELYYKSAALIGLLLAFLAAVVTAAACVWRRRDAASIAEDAYMDAMDDGEEETVAELVQEEQPVATDDGVQRGGDGIVVVHRSAESMEG
nr:membrane protein m20 [Mastomys natalensis cytomegalovirus 1]